MSARIARRRPLTMPALLLASMMATASAAAQAGGPEARITFDIPAQPLAHALLTYGGVTGHDIFYNAALANQQRSAAVVGSYTASEALQTLLLGTGYVARLTAPGAFVIEPAPRRTALPAHAPVPRRQLDAYFARLQSAMSAVLCARANLADGRDEQLLQLWLSASGVVARAEVIDYEGRPRGEQALAGALRGQALTAPPPGVAQPITLVIFPSAPAGRACAAGRPQR